MTSNGGPGRTARINLGAGGPGGRSASTMPTGQELNQVQVLALLSNFSLSKNSITGGAGPYQPPNRSSSGGGGGGGGSGPLLTMAQAVTTGARSQTRLTQKLRRALRRHKKKVSDLAEKGGAVVEKVEDAGAEHVDFSKRATELTGHVEDLSPLVEALGVKIAEAEAEHGDSMGNLAAVKDSHKTLLDHLAVMNDLIAAAAPYGNLKEIKHKNT